MRIIGHIDMDAFFASIEQRDNPKLLGRPLVIGSDPKQGKGRGVVSTASYQARQYGIKSGMPISTAWQLSQKAKASGQSEAIFMRPNMAKVDRASHKVIEIVSNFCDQVEVASVDEAYFDLSSEKSFEKALVKAEKIKDEIFKKEKLTCSIGVSSNKLMAKIACQQQKPNGLTLVLPHQVQALLDGLDVSALPGIGPRTKARLSELKVFSIKDLREKLTKKKLEEVFGKSGLSMYEKARGQDDSLLEEYREHKSIGAQQTFQQDTRDFSYIGQTLENMADEIIFDMKKDGFSAFKNITLTVRFSDFKTKDRSLTLKEPSNSAKTLAFEAVKMLLPFFDSRENPHKKKIRLIGIRIKDFSKVD